MQYFKLKGNYGKAFIDDKYENHESYPVFGVAYETWRGKDVYWTVDGSNVETESYLDVLRKKCGGTILFDMPTEAQWEFACRGRNYTNPLYTGKSWTGSSLNEIAWSMSNSSVNEAFQPHVVGRKYPNVYGLYDMNGNMSEWCLDWAKENTDYEWKSTAEPEVNPKGILKENITLDQWGSGLHITRGASYNGDRTYCHSAYRAFVSSSSTGSVCMRVCCPAE